MRPTLVLGVGNRLMMDDGVGIAVVELLARSQPPDGEVRYEIGETDFAYCLELAEQTDRLILVDAVATDQRPGDVTLVPLKQISPSGPGLSLHHAHLVDLLLQRDPQTNAVLVGIEPFEIAFHWGLSPELEGEFDRIVRAVKEAIDGLRR